MRFLSRHARAFCSLISAAVCASALLSGSQTARAGFTLSGDQSIGLAAKDDADNLATYLPATVEAQEVDLSVSSNAGTARTSAPAPTETTPDPTSAVAPELAQVAALSRNSTSQAAGTSAPTGSLASGAPAAIHAVYHTPTDLQVTGWLQDASRLSLPKSMPRALLRPPQA